MKRSRSFSAAVLAMAAALPALAQSHTAADLGRAVLAAGLDPAAAYRVRDLEISHDEAQFYLTDGYLIFGRPVSGAPVAALFTADVAGGDGEVLILPPDRSERKALAANTGAPNLDEHFVNVVFLFTESRARRLLEEIRAKGEAKPAPEVAAVLSDQWSRVLGNIASSYESRIVLDLIDGTLGDRGFFEAIVQGRKLGNFDVGYDGRSYEQLTAGQMVTRGEQTFWNTWMSFVGRNRRSQPAPIPEEQILSYRIDARLDASLELRCETHLRVRVTANSQNALAFDLSAQMRATEATIDGVPAEVYERDSLRNGFVQNSGNELLLVVPAQPLEAGSEHDVEIRHQGKVIVDTGHQVFFVNSRGTWYPNRGAQFANYDVTYRYPKGLDLVSAGQVKEDRTDGETRVTRYVPNGRVRMLAFNLGHYERKVVERNGFRIEVSANREVEDALRPRQSDVILLDSGAANRQRGPGRSPRSPIAETPELLMPVVVNPGSQLTHIADEVAASIDFYRAHFGDPPVNSIEVSPVPGRFGQGFAGMIYLSTLSYLPVTVRPLSLMPPWQQMFYGDLLRAHEAAHQWWGNIVTAGSYRHEWLMEAIANYSALLFLENRNGPKVVDTMLDQYRRQLLTKGPDGEITESQGPVVQGRRLESSNNPNAWTVIAYGKGTWIIHMLRRRLGDAQFTKMLAELRRRYEWKTVDTEQFRLLCAEFMPAGSPDPKLENFFDQWIYGTGIPGLKLTSSVKGKPGALKLTGTVSQSGVPDDFTVTVPVEIQTGRGRVVKQIRTSSDPVSFSVPVSVANARAVLDPGSSVLRR